MSARKCCFFRYCQNNRDTSKKQFFWVPRDASRRIEWFQAAGVPMNSTDRLCCEDHFILEQDTENWRFYKLGGRSLRLKPDVVPRELLIHDSTRRTQTQLTDAEKKMKEEFLNSLEWCDKKKKKKRKKKEEAFSGSLYQCHHCSYKTRFKSVLKPHLERCHLKPPQEGNSEMPKKRGRPKSKGQKPQEGNSEMPKKRGRPKSKGQKPQEGNSEMPKKRGRPKSKGQKPQERNSEMPKKKGSPKSKVQKAQDETVLSCKVCEFVASDRRNFDIHMKNHLLKREIAYFPCVICNFMALDRNAFEKHMKNSHSIECEGNYKVPKSCAVQRLREQRARNGYYKIPKKKATRQPKEHKAESTFAPKEQKAESTLAPKEQKGENVPVIPCIACQFTALNRCDFENHMKDVHAMDFEWNFEVPKKRAKRRPKEQKTQNIPVFPCILCPFLAANRSDFENHMKESHSVDFDHQQSLPTTGKQHCKQSPTSGQTEKTSKPLTHLDSTSTRVDETSHKESISIVDGFTASPTFFETGGYQKNPDNKRKLLACALCPYKSISLLSITNHLNVRHSYKIAALTNYDCSLCQFNFDDRDSLMDHLSEYHLKVFKVKKLNETTSQNKKHLVINEKKRKKNNTGEESNYTSFSDESCSQYLNTREVLVKPENRDCQQLASIKIEIEDGDEELMCTVPIDTSSDIKTVTNDNIVVCDYFTGAKLL